MHKSEPQPQANHSSGARPHAVASARPSDHIYIYDDVYDITRAFVRFLPIGVRPARRAPV